MNYKTIILQFLQERRPNKFSAAQIVYFLKQQGLSESVIFANLKKMVELKEIEYTWLEQMNRNKRPCRVYWVKQCQKN